MAVYSSTMIQIFLSHSGEDKALADSVSELLKAALHLAANEIRCTSVQGSRLPGGAHIAEQLRNELLVSPTFVGLISARSFSSAYVLFELGARWGADKHLIPLLAPGVSSGILKGPISGLNALRCDERDQLHQLVEDLATSLGKTLQPSSSYQAKIDAIMAYRSNPRSATPTSSVPNKDSSSDDAGGYAEADELIKAQSLLQWPEDLHMQVHFIRQQREALSKLKEGCPPDIPNDTFAKIRAAGAAQWPKDYHMRYYMEEQQFAAYRELNKN